MGLNVGRLLSASAVRFPGKTALIQGNRRINYRDFNQRVNALGHGLLGLGVKKGDKVSLFLRNSMEWAEIYFALSKIGAVVVPVNIRLKGDELAHIFGNSESKVVFFDEDLRQYIEAVKNHLRGMDAFIALGSDSKGPYISYDRLFVESVRGEPDVQVFEDDTHSICYTSGTTGLPKGAVLTHINIILMHALINPIEFEMGPGDVTLATTPFSQRIGWAKIVTSISLGSTLVILPSFNAEEVMKIVEKERVTNISIVPTIGRRILGLPDLDSFDTSSLKKVFVSGEAFPVDLKKRFMAHFPHIEIVGCYASTEAGQVSIMKSVDVLKKPDSVGRPLPFTELRIVDDRGKDVRPGGVGEIAVRSGGPGNYCIMKEYYKDPEYTAGHFSGDWLLTGDVGRVDEEGYLYVVDRKKDMIISGGFNIYSREVEAVLESHEKISEAAVVGVPDEEFGEAVKGFVVLAHGQRITEQEIIDYCRTKLASYKKPKYIEFIDSVPRNASGKILKYELKQLRPGTVHKNQNQAYKFRE
jgi:long-chain acyl-CoA synthetase